MTNNIRLDMRLFGVGGATIREITEATNCIIDINDDGMVTISAASNDDGIRAREWAENITADVELNKVTSGKVTKITNFGAFVEVLSGKEGLLHISQITQERLENISDYVEQGQLIQVKVIDIDDKGRIHLSTKGLKTA